MTSHDEREGTLNLFPGSHHQALNNPDFKVAGRDVFTPTISPTINVNVTASAPAGSWARYNGLAQDSVDPFPEPPLPRRRNPIFRGPRSPHPVMSPPAQMVGDLSQRPPDPTARRDLSSLPSSSSSSSSSPHPPPPARRPATDPPSGKAQDPRRLSNMFVSLRRLINPRTSSSPPEPHSPREIPVRRTPQEDQKGRYGSPTHKSLHRHASWDSNASVDSRDSEFTVSSIDEPDNWNVEPPKITTPDVYVSRMLKSGKGLACWQPQPQKPYAGEHGTVPGDIGTFTAEGGFKRIFNLWEDSQLARKVDELYKDGHPPVRLPQRKVVLAENRLAKGDTVVQGTTGKTVYGDDDKTIRCFEFQCRAQEGALLAVTSPADLEELEDHTALREYIFQHAELIYRHSNTIRRLADEEPLYIITGCIKSETWAIAAFNDPTTSTTDVLQLVNLPRSTGEDRYVWTDRATSEARVGRSEGAGQKDQTLFLRGFKLAFSLHFLRRMKSSRQFRPVQQPVYDAVLPPKGQSPPGLDVIGSDDKKVKLCDFDDSDASDASAEPQEIPSGLDPAYHVPAYRHGIPSHQCASREVQVIPIFPQSSQYPCHPCDIINKYILDNTEADFALSHDDDWSFLLEDPLWSDLLCSGLEEAPSDLISVRKGVAFLTDAGTEESPNKGQEDEDPTNTVPSKPSGRDGVHGYEPVRHRDLRPIPSSSDLAKAYGGTPMKPVHRPLKSGPSAWQLFFRDWTQRQEQLGRPKLNISRAVKEAAQEYRSMSAREQEPYKRRSQTAKKAQEMENEACMHSLSPEGTRQERNFQPVQRKARRSRREDTEGTSAPKKPLGAWLQFLYHIRADPDLAEDIFGDETDLRKQDTLAAAKWRSMSDEGRRPFTARAEKEKIKYEEACLRYEEETSQSPMQPLSGGGVDHEDKLRQTLGISSEQPVNLWSLPDPEGSQRPPHPYSLLVQLAIYGNPSRHVTLEQIYSVIEDRFEYYRNRPEGSWKAEIRHSLSLNQVLRNTQGPSSLDESWEGTQCKTSYPTHPNRSRHPTRPHSFPKPASPLYDAPWSPSSGSDESEPYQSAQSSQVDVFSAWSTPNDSQASLA